MFRRLPDRHGEPINFTFDAQPLVALRGDSVATALLAAGINVCRTTPVSGADRGPYCMMGVCFDCLVVINGLNNRQGCLVLVEEGMRVETQRGAASYGGSTGQ
jgi:hypothetical protein